MLDSFDAKLGLFTAAISLILGYLSNFSLMLILSFQVFFSIEILTTNVAPLPNSLSTEMLPLSTSTNSLTSANQCLSLRSAAGYYY